MVSAELQIQRSGRKGCFPRGVEFVSKRTEIVRLMAPQFVTPYVKSRKNDAFDAEMMCNPPSSPTDGSFRRIPVEEVRAT